MYRMKDLLDYSSCLYLITEQPVLDYLAGANFMGSGAVIKIEVSGRFNSLHAFRGFIGL